MSVAPAHNDGAPDYWEFRLRPTKPETPDVLEALMALLAQYPFEAFEEDGDTLLTWIPVSALTGTELDSALAEVHAILPFHSSRRAIKTENWNVLWESNFPPVVVSSKTVIRAPFHPPFGDRETEIVIEPKMAFGTGHHSTTRLMLRLLEEIDWPGKTVFDLGTGTGVLAIYAGLKGAKQIEAIDNHSWSVQNARENAARNGVSGIHIQEGDIARLADQKADVILANIQLNVILEHMASFSQMLNADGTLLLSGLLTEDEVRIMDAARLYNLHHEITLREEAWIALRFAA